MTHDNAQRTIYVTSGLTDIEISGNQSFKNALKHLSEFGFEVVVFTLLPGSYENLLSPTEAFTGGRAPTFHRLPSVLEPFVRFGRYLKDSIGRRRVSPNRPNRLETVDHYDEYNIFGRSLYIGFLVFAMAIELLRVGWYALRRRPTLFYGVNGQGALVASVLGRLFRRPVVTRFHGTVIQERDLLDWRRRLLKCDEYVPLRVYADLQIMTDDGTRGDVILRRTRHRVKRQVFWRNGFDLDNLRPTSQDKRRTTRGELGIDGHLVLFMASRLTKWKRVDRGIEALSKFLAKTPNANVTLLLAGDGPQMGALQTFAQSLGLGTHLRFLGHVPHTELHQYFGAADVFMSLYDVSNLTNPVLEALLYGLPVISIRDGTTDRLLVHEKNALLCAPDEAAQQAAEFIGMLYRQPALRIDLAQQAVSIGRAELWSWKQRMQAEIEELMKLIRTH